MNKEIFNQSHVFFDKTATTQDEAFKVIATLASELGYVADVDDYFVGLKEREEEATTGFKDQIAIPHSKNKTVLKPGMFLVKFAHSIPWNALDGPPVRVAFALTIPIEGSSEHLKLLSLIARKLIDNEFRESILKENNSQKLTEIINQISF